MPFGFPPELVFSFPRNPHAANGLHGRRDQTASSGIGRALDTQHPVREVCSSSA